MSSSFQQQLVDLNEAGFPNHVIVCLAQSNAVRRAWFLDDSQRRVGKKKKFAIISYIHHLSHNLKKIGRRGKVDIVFSAPNKLMSLCAKTTIWYNKGCVRKAAQKRVR